VIEKLKEEISILLVDDDEIYREILKEEMLSLGYAVTHVASGEKAVEAVTSDSFDVVLLDIKMPGMGGIETLKSIGEISPLSEVIMLTGYGTIDSAISSMKLGAYDYLTKPCKVEKLDAIIQKALEKRNLSQENVILKQELARRDESHGIVGRSEKLMAVLEAVKKVAKTNSTVLILGDSGVGKELVAQAIHRNSSRNANPFVVVDCGALQETLLESELFGHEKGAYTGAIHLKHGLIEVAHTGTLFLDEAGEISTAIQVKLLRALDMGTFRRLGGTKDIRVDVRLVAATNQDLEQLVAEGKFREDLFYRLNVFTITIPPLRERKEDIPLLVRHFIETTGITGKEKTLISPEAMNLLLSYHWPGNIRELQNIIERAIILSENNVIRPQDLPLGLREEPKLSYIDKDNTLKSLRSAEKTYISKVLEEVGGHRGKAAQVLRISERTLYRKLKKYNIRDNEE
jgi:DNA-binding NtrC family response regulator